MPEPLKNIYTRSFIAELCEALEISYPKFDSQGFADGVFDEAWEGKELKARMGHIAEILHRFLPMGYRESLDILMAASPGFGGFEAMFFPDFVERYGLSEFEDSMEALELFTKVSSSEFAVRAFIKRDPQRMMAQMEVWADSKNEDVRRLATEGCRPRLPWAMALPDFKTDPLPVLEILEKLKEDESEYVRRSVANNLNDISKDHPELVIRVALSWLGKSSETDWVVKHACRTLLKQGDPDALALFGFGSPGHIEIEDLIVDESVAWGDSLTFSFRLQTPKKRLGKLRIEYGIDFMKNNGRQSRTIFKISESDFPSQEKQVARSHAFKPISTRKYYAGAHGIAIILNGQEVASGAFELVM